MSAEREHPAIVHIRRRWAQRYLDAGRSWHIYGSIEWCDLADDDPRKVAACVAAAEVYTRDRFDDLDEWVRAEIEAMRLAFKIAEDEAYQQSVADHRRRHGGRIRSTIAERRARQLDAVKPRAGDHPGGPGKPWTTGGAS